MAVPGEGLAVLAWQPNGQITVRVNDLVPGMWCTIETNRTLGAAAQWEPFSSYESSTSLFDFMDPDASPVEYPQKFYRVSQP